MCNKKMVLTIDPFDQILIKRLLTLNHHHYSYWRLQIKKAEGRL